MKGSRRAPISYWDFLKVNSDRMSKEPGLEGSAILPTILKTLLFLQGQQSVSWSMGPRREWNF